MYSIEELRRVNRPQNIIITKHSRIRLSERGISIDDIVNIINNGEIIEEYPTDVSFPSCLILGMSINNKYLHAVISLNENFINLITAYHPDPSRWNTDFKTRKET